MFALVSRFQNSTLHKKILIKKTKTRFIGVPICWRFCESVIICLYPNKNKNTVQYSFPFSCCNSFSHSQHLFKPSSSLFSSNPLEPNPSMFSSPSTTVILFHRSHLKTTLQHPTLVLFLDWLTIVPSSGKPHPAIHEWNIHMLLSFYNYVE